jgi:hypothetical protein
MPQAKFLAFAFFIAALDGLILTTALASRQHGANEQKTAKQKNPDFSRFPLVDFHAPQPVDENLRAAREAKGRKYNNKHMPQISQETYQVFSNSDWDVRLPALPVERSAAVVIGTVTSAHAYLTPDKAGIYSEFHVATETVIKNDPDNKIKAGAPITVERAGGRVRMPSGKIVVSWVNHQNMPRAGVRYVLFLTREFETRNDTPKDFYLLSGYELRDGHVHLLDDTQPGHPITRYDGAPETTLLSDLVNTVANPSNPSEQGNFFRYRAKVKDVQGNQSGRWAWDVLLIAQP